jgi:hypothetical protein
MEDFHERSSGHIYMGGEKENNDKTKMVVERESAK